MRWELAWLKIHMNTLTSPFWDKSYIRVLRTLGRHNTSSMESVGQNSFFFFFFQFLGNYPFKDFTPAFCLNHLHKKTNKLLIRQKYFHTDYHAATKRPFYFIRSGLNLLNFHTNRSINPDGCVEWTLHPSPTTATTSTRMAAKLIICVSEHQALLLINET